MPPLIAGAVVWAVSSTSVFATVATALSFGIGGIGGAILGGALTGAIIGAAVGAGSAALMGKDIKSGALWGAVSGAFAGGFAGATKAKDGWQTFLDKKNAVAPNLSEPVNQTPGPQGAEQTVNQTAGSGEMLDGYGNVMKPEAPPAATPPPDGVGEYRLALADMAKENAKTQMIGQAVTAGAQGLLQPSQTEIQDSQLKNQMALDESRKVKIGDPGDYPDTPNYMHVNFDQATPVTTPSGQQPGRTYSDPLNPSGATPSRGQDYSQPLLEEEKRRQGILARAGGKY